MPFEKGHKKGNRFGKDNQPSHNKRSMGQKKRRTREQLMKDMMQSKPSREFLESLMPIITKLGIDPDTVDNELMMHLRQLQKAIQEGDVRSYTALLDRFVGKPKQEHDVNQKSDIDFNILGWLPPETDSTEDEEKED